VGFIGCEMQPYPCLVRGAFALELWVEAQQRIANPPFRLGNPRELVPVHAVARVVASMSRISNPAETHPLCASVQSSTPFDVWRVSPPPGMVRRNQHTRSMNTTFTSFFPTTLFAALAGESTPDAPRDLTDPAETLERHGLRCELHGCARELGEAPLVRAMPSDRAIAPVKRRAFPQSWTAVASCNAPRPTFFRRPRMTVVRYCPECREAAAAWLAEHAMH